MERKLNRHQIHKHNMEMEKWYKHFKFYEDLEDILERLGREGMDSELSGDERELITRFLNTDPSYMYTVDNVPRGWLMNTLFNNLKYKKVDSDELIGEINEWIAKYKLKIKLRD